MPINISTVKMGVHFLSRKFHHLVCPSLTAFKSVVLISLLAINNFSHVFRLFLAAHCRGLTPHGLTCAARPTRPDLRGPTYAARPTRPDRDTTCLDGDHQSAIIKVKTCAEVPVVQCPTPRASPLSASVNSLCKYQQLQTAQVFELGKTDQQ